MLAVLLWAAVANAASVEALVSLSQDGQRLLEARLVGEAPRTAPRGPVLGVGLSALGADGAVLATASIPDPRLRSVHHVGTTGHAVVLDQAVARVVLDWPEGAVAVALGEQRRIPHTPPPSTAEPVLSTGDSTERLDMVFVGDGYTETQLGAFAEDVDRMVAYLLSIEPYAAYADLFNVWRIDAPSAESGVDHPERSPSVERDTAFGCFYGCAGIDRLICCDDGAVLSAVSAAVPAADGIMVLINDPQYGGSGGYQYATSYVGATGDRVVAHELGHSLVGLGDEYNYGTPTGAAARPNCTADPSDPPWTAWLDEPGVGAHAVCGYTNHHRPTADGCMMRTLTDDYCVVCRELATLAIYGALPRLLVSVSPSEDAVVAGTVLTATATVIGSTPWRFEGVWTLDGVVVGEGLSLEVEPCTTGELELTVQDPTPWVRHDPGANLMDSHRWTLLPCPDGGGGDTDTDGTQDSADPVGPADSAAPPPGDQAESDVPGSCGCQSGGSAPAALLGLLIPLFLRGRRPPTPGHPPRPCGVPDAP